MDSEDNPCRFLPLKPIEIVIDNPTVFGGINELGMELNVLIPLELLRYSATYASCTGMPLKIVSKVILRHQDLKDPSGISGEGHRV